MANRTSDWFQFRPCLTLPMEITFRSGLIIALTTKCPGSPLPSTTSTCKSRSRQKRNEQFYRDNNVGVVSKNAYVVVCIRNGLGVIKQVFVGEKTLSEATKTATAPLTDNGEALEPAKRIHPVHVVNEHPCTRVTLASYQRQRSLH